MDAAPVDAPISLEALESLHDRRGGYVAPAPSSAKDAATLNELLKAGKNSGAAARTQAIRDTAL